MRLAQVIVIDKEKIFGLRRLSALSREVFLQNEDGIVSTEVQERTYDLKSREQRRMIQVSLPASVPCDKNILIQLSKIDLCCKHKNYLVLI